MKPPKMQILDIDHFQVPAPRYEPATPRPEGGFFVITIADATQPDGAWRSGICFSLDAAQKRCATWLGGGSLSEEPSGIASRAQAEAAREAWKRKAIRGASSLPDLILALQSDTWDPIWVIGTDAVYQVIDDPRVEAVKPTYIRRQTR
jgi:hypothetical protein